MKPTYMLITAALSLFGCDALNPNPGPEPNRPQPAGGGGSQSPGGGGFQPAGGGGAQRPGGGGLAQTGQALYIQYCAVCHGADGSGAGPFPDSIQGATGMLGVVQNGVGEMPAFPQLTAEDVLAMEAYLATFANSGGGGGALPPPTPPETWQAHYQQQCSACHGANGEGNALGPQIQSPVYPYATWVTRNGRSGVGYPGAMPGYSEAELPTAMLDGIMSWLAEAPQPRDGRGLNARYCANCHGADGRGGPTRASIIGEDLDEFIETVREGEGGRNYGARGDYMPAWSSLELSNAEIRLIWDFLHGRGGAAPPTSSNPPASTPPPEEEEEEDDD